MGRKKVDRTGYRNQNKQGEWMEIIEYFDNRNLTVKFDVDGTIIKNVTHQNFKNGNVARINLNTLRNTENAKDRVGKRNQNTKGEWMEIIEYRKYSDITVRFDDGGIIVKTRYGDFKKGSVAKVSNCSKEVQEKLKQDRIGERKENNQGEWMEIVEYINCMNIAVKFDVDRIVVKNITYGQFKNGQVANPFNANGEYKRPELRFLDRLKITLKTYDIELETQKSMFGGKYRIDFYLPEYNLAVEYDEQHHKSQQESDKLRELEIKSELNCEFLRLDYSNEDEYNVQLVLDKIAELS